MDDTAPEAWKRQADRMEREQAEREKVNVDRLKSGDGGGTFDDMEDRVRRLETRLDKFADDVTDIKVNLATLIERVSHLPGKGFIVSAVVTAITIIGGIVLMADRLKNLF